MRLRTSEYILKDPKIAKEKIVINISDIHGNIQVFKKVVDLLQRQKIDMICMPGDILDHVDDVNKTVLLKELKRLSVLAKVYISLGNHDIFKYKGKKEVASSDRSFFEEVMFNTDCYILGGEYSKETFDDSIDINALNLPFEWYGKYEDRQSLNDYISGLRNLKFNQEKFSILLCHTPNALIRSNKIINNNNIVNHMNLILSGHNHGGLTPQVFQNIPNFHLGLVGPYAKILKSNSYGYWTEEDKSLIISGGITKISTSSEIPGLSKINGFFPAEIDRIHLLPGDRHKLQLVKKVSNKL